ITIRSVTESDLVLGIGLRRARDGDTEYPKQDCEYTDEDHSDPRKRCRTLFAAMRDEHDFLPRFRPSMRPLPDDVKRQTESALSIVGLSSRAFGPITRYSVLSA